MTDYDTLYPKLPQPSGENFRLHKVNEALVRLNHELKHYEKVKKNILASDPSSTTVPLLRVYPQ